MKKKYEFDFIKFSIKVGIASVFIIISTILISNYLGYNISEYFIPKELIEEMTNNVIKSIFPPVKIEGKPIDVNIRGDYLNKAVEDNNVINLNIVGNFNIIKIKN